MSASSWRSIDNVPAFGEDARVVNVVVDTPAGSRCKFRYEAGAGLFSVAKVLPAGFIFPFDFGFIPGTRGEDGDPVDVMLIAEAGTGTGCLVPARLFGVLEAEQDEGGKTAVRNDRLLAVPLFSRQYANLTRPRDMPRALREQIEHFLKSYGVLDDKILRIRRVGGPRRAAALVRQASGEAGSA